MTKVFCDLCEQECDVHTHNVIVGTDIAGHPRIEAKDVCDKCWQEIIEAQVRTYRDIRRRA